MGCGCLGLLGVGAVLLFGLRALLGLIFGHDAPSHAQEPFNPHPTKSISASPIPGLTPESVISYLESKGLRCNQPNEVLDYTNYFIWSCHSDILADAAGNELARYTAATGVHIAGDPRTSVVFQVDSKSLPPAYYDLVLLAGLPYTGAEAEASRQWLMAQDQAGLPATSPFGGVSYFYRPGAPGGADGPLVTVGAADGAL